MFCPGRKVGTLNRECSTEWPWQRAQYPDWAGVLLYSRSIACRKKGSCFYIPWNGWDTIPKWEKLVCCLVVIARRRASLISWHQSCTSSITTLDFLCKSGSAPWSFCQSNCYDGVIGALLDTCQWSALPKLRYSSVANTFNLISRSNSCLYLLFFLTNKRYS